MQTVYYNSIALACAMLVQASVASAGEEDDLVAIYGDKATVSIATGSQQPLRRAPAVATVITAEDITMMGANQLEQVLESVPGMHVSHSGVEWEPLYIVRGVYSSSNPQILVLQNGVPMTTDYTGSRGITWSSYPVTNIARIEIIRGPGSALYGADAYSGVINIITKTAADISGTQFGVAAGSFNTRDVFIQHGGKIGSVAVAGYLRVGGTDGEKETITADAQSARDKVFGTKASLAPGGVNTGYDSVDGNLDISHDKWRFRSGYMLRSNVGTGAGAAAALDPVGKVQGERITSDLSWTDNQLTKNWGVGLLGSYLGYKQRVTTNLVLSPPGTRFPTGVFPGGMIGHPDFSERDLRISGFATYSGFNGHSLRFGMGHDDLNIYETKTIKNHLPNPAGIPIPQPAVADYSLTSPFMLPQRRKVDYFYAQDIYQFHRDWSLTAGIRHDKFSDVGSTTNPRLALVWDASLDLTAKLLYGKAFRAPSFNELHGINAPVLTGNKDLVPEKVQTMEVALSWENSQKDLQVNLNMFRFTMDKIIRVVPNDVLGTGSTFHNIGRQVGRGLELEIVREISRSLHVSGNYAYQQSTDVAHGTDAGYAPHHHMFLKGDWHFADGWLLGPQFDWVAGRKREFGDTRAPIPDYKSVDLTLKTTKIRNFDISATVRNLFNADIREPSAATIPNDLPMAKRSFYIQLVYKL